ncbi:MAG: nicotinate (nicotinamide) nucleotide adenylyltransferase [Clostridia bacterium]|nr:nicotinate (nicotinamide) nucleotide adenylyltransferase [Clostridia bacterium]
MINMKIGIFGGAFDPPHKGHERALSVFLEEVKPDLCYCVPTGNPPHKALSGEAAPSHRLEMAKRAFLPISERVRIWEGELKKEEPSYTYKTLEEIAELHPAAELFLFVGTDQFLAIDTWREPKRIFSAATLCVMARHGYGQEELLEKKRALEKEFGAATLLLQGKAYIISSTAVRKEISEQGFSLSLSPLVNQWITESELYVPHDPDRHRALELIKDQLSPHRFSHTLAVEREVAVLCKLLNALDSKELRLAALYHDRTKEWSDAEHIAFLREQGLPLPSEDVESPAVLHGRTAAHLAVKELGLSQKAADAILCHTTGKAGMTLEEKILYLADFMEETRKYETCHVIRRLFYENLPEDREGRISRLNICVLAAMEHTLERLKKEKSPIHPQTLLGAMDLKKKG